MVHIVLDTNVWVDLLKAPMGTKLNLFDEFMYWFESGQLQSVTCQNIKVEWDRTKTNPGVISTVKEFHKVDLHRHPDNTTTTDNEFITDNIQKRIDQIDYILREKSIIASHNEQILLTAASRSLYKKGPCHKKDSFLDAVNIYSVIEYLKTNSCDPIWFTTINYTDFSESEGKKHALHPDLIKDFTDVKLEYHYYNDKNSASSLMQNILRPRLPDYTNYVKEQQKQRDQLAMQLVVSTAEKPFEIDETEYIRHLEYIDLITARDNPSSLELGLLEMITSSHPNYKQYFLKKLSER